MENFWKSTYKNKLLFSIILLPWQPTILNTMTECHWRHNSIDWSEEGGNNNLHLQWRSSFLVLIPYPIGNFCLLSVHAPLTENIMFLVCYHKIATATRYCTKLVLLCIRLSLQLLIICAVREWRGIVGQHCKWVFWSNIFFVHCSFHSVATTKWTNK